MGLMEDDKYIEFEMTWRDIPDKISIGIKYVNLEFWGAVMDRVTNV